MEEYYVTNDSHANERGRDSSSPDRFLHHHLLLLHATAAVRPFFAPSIGTHSLTRQLPFPFQVPTNGLPLSVTITSCAAAQKQSICSGLLPMLTWASPPPLPPLPPPMHGVTKQRSEELVKQSGSSNPIALPKGRKEEQNAANSSQ